jgi:hypothetical protein
MRIKNPCKNCIVQPMCHQICSERLNYSDTYQKLSNYFLLVTSLVIMVSSIVVAQYIEYLFNSVVIIMSYIFNILIWWLIILRRYSKIRDYNFSQFYFSFTLKT